MNVPRPSYPRPPRPGKNKVREEENLMFIGDQELIIEEKISILIGAKIQCKEEIKEINLRIKRFKDMLESKYITHKNTEADIKRMIKSDNKKIERIKQQINFLETWIEEIEGE